MSASSSSSSYSSSSSSDSDWSIGSSTSSDSDSDSDFSPRQILVSPSELRLLKRDELYLSRLASRRRPPAPNQDEHYRWMTWDVLSLTLLVAFFLAVWVWWGVICPPQQQQQVVRVPLEQDFTLMVRPSDTFAMRKVAFHLPSKWTEWITLPPLGMAYWKGTSFSGDQERGEARQGLKALQTCVRTVDQRGDYRDAKRKSWVGAFKDIGMCLERMEECSLRSRKAEDSLWSHLLLGSAADRDCKALLREAAADHTGMKELRKVMDDILDHIVQYELSILDECFFPAFSGLSIASEARSREINREIYDLAVEAAGRPLSAVPPGLSEEEENTSLLLLLSDSEKSRIARAREQYGILTFLALISHALPPAMQERKEDILLLKVRVEALKEELAAEYSNCTSSSLNGQGCGMTVVRNVFRRLPTVAELDAMLREKALRAPTIRRIALEWMETHTLALRTEQQHRSAVNHDSSNPQNSITTTSTSTTTPPASSIPSSSPLSRFPPTTIPSPVLHHHLAATAQRIHHLIWTHPKLGAASWHWEGSSPIPRSATSSPSADLETALLFAGLDVPDHEDDAGVLGADERWEDYRYRMMPRGDGADLRVCWPERYHGGLEVCSSVEQGLKRHGLG